MSNYIVDGADLTDIADAIRAKGGTSGQLQFPQGFVDAVEAIETGGGDLPSEYQQVDYVETDGNSRIDTGIAFDASKDFVLKAVAMINPSMSQTNLARNSGWNAGGTFGVAFTSSKWFWYDGLTPSSSYNLAASSEATKIEITIEAGANANTISKYSDATNSKTLTRTHPNVANRTFLNFPLFAASAQNDYSYTPAGLRIRSAIIILGSEMKRDLVACYRKADGVIGFYDRLNDVFYTNQGAGTFLKGLDVLSAQQALEILLGGAT